MKKIHTLGSAALAAALLTAVSAYAQIPVAKFSDCSEATMKTAYESMMKMTDATKKAAVMKEMDLAKGMMAKKDEKGCMTQMDKAMGLK